MYSPLNEDLMFQDRHDRTTRLVDGRGTDPTAWPTRRWWHRAVHRAR